MVATSNLVTDKKIKMQARWGRGDLFSDQCDLAQFILLLEEIIAKLDGQKNPR